MPILPLEPFVFPDDLFARPAVPPEAGAWWVLHVRPRAEKALARQLRNDRTAFFLPLGKKRSCIRGRTFTAHVPLFPGYVFLLGDDRARVEALRTKLVVRSLPVPDQAELHEALGLFTWS